MPCGMTHAGLWRRILGRRRAACSVLQGPAVRPFDGDHCWRLVARLLQVAAACPASALRRSQGGAAACVPTPHPRCVTERRASPAAARPSRVRVAVRSVMNDGEQASGSKNLAAMPSAASDRGNCLAARPSAPLAISVGPRGSGTFLPEGTQITSWTSSHQGRAALCIVPSQYLPAWRCVGAACVESSRLAADGPGAACISGPSSIGRVTGASSGRGRRPYAGLRFGTLCAVLRPAHKLSNLNSSANDAPRRRYHLHGECKVLSASRGAPLLLSSEPKPHQYGRLLGHMLGCTNRQFRAEGDSCVGLSPSS